MAIEKYPLQWPTGYSRKQRSESSRFKNVSFAKARDQIFYELGLMLSYSDRHTIVMSTNIPLKLDGLPYASYRQPEDKGVAVYFQFKGESVVLCCDTWDKIEHNLWAIAKTVEAMRGIERWGVSDFLKHSFQGFVALPPKKAREWWEVLQYISKPHQTSESWYSVTNKYKSLAKKHHPDVTGGSTEKFQELHQAYKEAEKYFNQ